MARWANWAGEQACEPAAIETPGTLDELRDAVRTAAAAGRRVRVSASGHSFTDCALTEGTMIRLDRLTRPLDFDAESGLFKVEAGSVLHDLNRLLDERGVAFENLGDIDRQTVAGSISTGTHGTGERFQNVSAQVAALEVVTADGSLVTIDDSEPDLLRAARVAIGALGVIYSVTIRTVPAYTINRVDCPAAARGDPRQPRRARRRHRPLRVLRLPAHRRGPLPRVAAHRRAAGAAQRRAGSTRRRS